MNGQFIPLMISTLLPILLEPSKASGDPRDRCILFGLMALIIIQSLRSVPAISPGHSSQLWLLAYRFVTVMAMVGTFAFIHFGETATLAFKAMLLPDALFFVMTSVRLAWLLARVPRVNGQVMAGATAGYLLLALTGGLLATTTQALAPGAFLLARRSATRCCWTG